MKLSFFYPFNLNSYSTKTSPPLGIAYIASYIEKYLDNSFEISIETDVNSLLKNKPDIVGINAYTETFKQAIYAAEQIKKESNIPIILGGIHITSLPKNLKKCFDIGIIGDGEQTMTELLELYLKKKCFTPEDLININGIVFYDGKEIIITQPRKLLKSLDILPPPKRSLLHSYIPSTNKEWYWTQDIYTSRGCPYKCTFCINSKISFAPRYHSPERVVEELLEIVEKYPHQKHISIYDELFITNKKRLKEISDLIVSEKINKKASFSCLCKSDIFDEETAEILKKMNVSVAVFGFESGDQNTLEYLKGKYAKVESSTKSIDICNKYGIHCGASFLLASPPETKEALNKTYWFIRQNVPPMSSAGIFYLTPFPNTVIWDLALEKGLVTENDEDWEHYNYVEFNESVHKKVFLNEHYSIDYFEDVYKNHFSKINNLVVSTYYKKPDEINYYNEIFKYLKTYNLNSDIKILEITNSFQISFENAFDENIDITKFDHWIYRSNDIKILEYEQKILENKSFDLIIFNHSLEQMKNPYEKLEYFAKNFLKKDGKVLILIKNEKFIENLEIILLNKWKNEKIGYKTEDNYHQINHNELINIIKNLDLKIETDIPVKVDISQYSQFYKNLIPLFVQNGIDIVDLLKDIDAASFFIIFKI